MLRIAANISMLFTDAPFLDRVERAAAAGFAAIECQFPYAHPAGALKAALDTWGMSLVLHNLPPGDWAAGDRGIACHPHRIAEFEEGVATAIAYATTLGCPQVNCLAGIPPGNVPESLARDTLLRNLAYAAGVARTAGIRVLVEPINTRDMPGYCVAGTREARAIIAEVGADNLFLQFDCYHMQIMEGDITRSLEANIDLIRHVQIADVPGRGEPGTGEINWVHILHTLETLGYDGWVGAEYHPQGRTEAGLGWIQRLTWR